MQQAKDALHTAYSLYLHFNITRFVSILRSHENKNNLYL